MASVASNIAMSDQAFLNDTTNIAFKKTIAVGDKSNKPLKVITVVTVVFTAIALTGAVLSDVFFNKGSFCHEFIQFVEMQPQVMACVLLVFGAFCASLAVIKYRERTKSSLSWYTNPTNRKLTQTEINSHLRKRGYNIEDVHGRGNCLYLSLMRGGIYRGNKQKMFQNFNKGITDINKRLPNNNLNLQNFESWEKWKAALPKNLKKRREACAKFLRIIGLSQELQWVEQIQRLSPDAIKKDPLLSRFINAIYNDILDVFYEERFQNDNTSGLSKVDWFIAKRDSDLLERKKQIIPQYFNEYMQRVLVPGSQAGTSEAMGTAYACERHLVMIGEDLKTDKQNGNLLPYFELPPEAYRSKAFLAQPPIYVLSLYRGGHYLALSKA